jgi:NitT/TauT family transport system substrate-binding protein
VKRLSAKSWKACRWTAVLCALAIGAFGVGACGDDDDDDAASGGTAKKEMRDLSLQLSWFADATQPALAVGLQKGYYEDEGINLEVIPGGPNNDGVASVASGKADIGDASDSGAFIMAVAQGIPIKAFAVSVQEHPYAFFSMPDTPLESPEDLKGLQVGAPATAEVLLKGFLAQNGMTEEDLGGFTPVSFEPTPLLQGKIDAWGAWLTDVPQLEQLPDGYHALQLWDNGLQQYGEIYYARPDFLAENGDVVQAFLRATARAWKDVQANPQEAAELTAKQYPDVKAADAQKVQEAFVPLVWNDKAEQNGWGQMDPAVWQEQIDLWDELGQFEDEAPALEDVIDTDALEATVEDRKQG